MDKYLEIDQVGMSFDKRGSRTVKDVTYIAPDGYVYTQEFKDSGLLEGTIRWVPAGQVTADLRQCDRAGAANAVPVVPASDAAQHTLRADCPRSG